MGKLFIGYGKPLKHISSVRQAHICGKSNFTHRYLYLLPVFCYPWYALVMSGWPLAKPSSTPTIISRHKDHAPRCYLPRLACSHSSTTLAQQHLFIPILPTFPSAYAVVQTLVGLKRKLRELTQLLVTTHLIVAI